ncbi:hypothetical protein JK635_01970 [Neobacillus sp. YIM B02564]|uniref:Uncharacterized protein n=1 Tax=Neobacillus paridis TaxID=2803862 RepID=A0ABS1TI65_9BACI|nr:hypothetical protein [Neobacillus paridis]MBL4951006.1 hypothetical protein [Neobacillus paridis]
MNKKKFSMEEVASFLEYVIISDTATEEEQILYEDYKWNGKLRNNHIYKSVLHKMRNEWFGK